MSFFNKTKSKSTIELLDYNGNHIYINGLLMNTPHFKQPYSLKSSLPITYDLYLQEFSDKFFKKLYKDASMVDTKNMCEEINESLVFALNNLIDIPSTLREYFFAIVTRYIEFLKAAVSFPNKTIVNDDINFYLPLLKEISIASKLFLLNNK